MGEELFLLQRVGAKCANQNAAISSRERNCPVSRGVTSFLFDFFRKPPRAKFRGVFFCVNGVKRYNPQHYE